MRGTNDQGIGIQISYSIGRVLLGFGLAALVAIPAGFPDRNVADARRAFDPFIQVLKPISPLAWMPLALFTIKDSATSSIFVIFICSLWPMLINTAFGVSSGAPRLPQCRAHARSLPGRNRVPGDPAGGGATILTGMRISVGIAWLVIVAAEMLVGGTGIGYYVWNEWNNLNLSA